MGGGNLYDNVLWKTWRQYGSETLRHSGQECSTDKCKGMFEMLEKTSKPAYRKMLIKCLGIGNHIKAVGTALAFPEEKQEALGGLWAKQQHHQQNRIVRLLYFEGTGFCV